MTQPAALPLFESSSEAPIVIIVPGLPAPQGSKSFKGMLRGKDGRDHAILVESSKRVKPWRKAVEIIAKATYRAPAIDTPVGLRMVFTMPKPQSAPKRRRTWPAVYPDLSKLARSTEDALVTAGVLADDALIVEYDRLAKVYPNEDPESLSAPGVRIEIRRIM
jgi:Holliday junction resolvase RusA-like endonuclease